MLGRLSIWLFVQILSGDLRLQQGSNVYIGSQRWGCTQSESREHTVSEDVSDAALLPGWWMCEGWGVGNGEWHSL